MLGAVGGYAELIEQIEGTHPQLRTWVAGLQIALEQDIRLTRELTAFGLADPAKPRVTDLRRVVTGFRGLLTMAAGPGVGLDMRDFPSVGRVFIGAGQMERVLLNLVLNAKDAMPRGGKISILLKEAAGDSANRLDSVFTVLEIADTGEGMDEATRDKMFEPFFTTKGDKGSGLGLAIVNQIMAQAGGFIRVESAPGHGTRIALYFPRIGLAGSE